MCSSSSNVCSSNYTFVQLQFTAMQCYAPDLAGGANSAPPDLLAGFWGDERKGKGKERARGERKGEDKEVIGERGEERRGLREVREKEWKGKGKTKKKGKGKGGILCSCDFFLRKKPCSI